jgi:hypothetical protein
MQATIKAKIADNHGGGDRPDPNKQTGGGGSQWNNAASSVHASIAATFVAIAITLSWQIIAKMH